MSNKYGLTTGGDYTLTFGNDYFDDHDNGTHYGDDIVHGLRGDDTIISGGGSDKLFGNAGDDFIFYNGSSATSDSDTCVSIRGGMGDDNVIFDLSQRFEGDAVLRGGMGQHDTVRFLFNGDGNHDWALGPGTHGGTVLENIHTGQTISLAGFEDVFLG